MWSFQNSVFGSTFGCGGNTGRRSPGSMLRDVLFISPNSHLPRGLDTSAVPRSRLFVFLFGAGAAILPSESGITLHRRPQNQHPAVVAG
jgi:hypothetical protein